MSLFSELKRNAKSALSNYWGSAIVVSLIPLLVSFLLGTFQMLAMRLVVDSFFPETMYVDTTTVDTFFQSLAPYTTGLIATAAVCIVFAMIMLLVLAPIQLGSFYWHYKLVQGKPQSHHGIFHFFESFRLFRRALFFQISLGIRKLLWAFLFFVLPLALLGTTSFFYTNQLVASSITPRTEVFWVMGIGVLCLLHLLICFLFIVYMCKYFLAPYLYVEDEMMTIKSSIKKSIENTKGYRFQIIGFFFTFIGWFLIMPFLPSLIYSLPYLQTSLAMYAHYLIETKKREQPILRDKPSAEIETIKPTLVSPPGTETSLGMLYDPNPIAPPQSSALSSVPLSTEADSLPETTEKNNYPSL